MITRKGIIALSEIESHKGPIFITIFAFNINPHVKHRSFIKVGFDVNSFCE